MTGATTPIVPGFYSEVATGFTGRMLALGAATVPAQVRSVTYHSLTDEGDA
jgi:hypothetical protein